MKYLLLPIIFLFSASFAAACSFTPDADRMQSAEDNVSKYQYVFVGKVLEKRELEDFSGTEYIFEVDNFHKGTIYEFIDRFDHRRHTVTSPGHSCGSFFEVGTVGVFFTNDPFMIDESNPQYFFNSVEEAKEKADSLFSTTVEPVVKPVGCTKEYKPVCGEIEVQCVQAPCPPIRQTYSNTCVMDADGATLVHLGGCEVEPKPTIKEQVEEIQETTNSFTSPTEGPLVGFVEPTSPPPTKEEPSKAENRSKILSFFDWWTAQVRGLFSWLF